MKKRFASQPQSVSEPLLQIRDSSDACVVEFGGYWRFDSRERLDEFMAQSQKREPCPGQLICDCSALESIDTIGALYLLRVLRVLAPEAELKWQGVREQHQALIALVHDSLEGDEGLPEVPRRTLLWRLGRRIVSAGRDIGDFLRFLGETLVAGADTLRRPRSFRVRELVAQLELVSFQAIPVVALVMVLIGVVFAYLFSLQSEKYGANIFIVDAVGLAMCRELSPVIVAIIVAGRSGSAFTAHIGSMKMNEEIDALVTLGLSPFKVLVIPRTIALIIAMPLLVFVGDIVGIAGGLAIADSRLGITWVTFLERLRVVLPLNSFLVGVGKAPVFALFIALIGCRMGMVVENNARSLGINTTSTVVQSIVSVILLNAAFAVIFVELGI